MKPFSMMSYPSGCSVDKMFDRINIQFKKVIPLTVTKLLPPRIRKKSLDFRFMQEYLIPIHTD